MFRASYGKEDKASDYIVEDSTFVYFAKRFAPKTVNGKQKKVLETLIQIFHFVFTDKEKAEEYIKKHLHCPILTTITIILSWMKTRRNLH